MKKQFTLEVADGREHICGPGGVSEHQDKELAEKCVHGVACWMRDAKLICLQTELGGIAPVYLRYKGRHVDCDGGQHHGQRHDQVKDYAAPRVIPL